MALTTPCSSSLTDVLDAAEIVSDTSHARLLGALDRLTERFVR